MNEPCHSPTSSEDMRLDFNKIKSRSLLKALISDSLIYLEEKAGVLPKEVFAKLEDSIYDEFKKVVDEG